MSSQELRNLKIKTSVVIRLTKELISYVCELDDNEKKTAEIRESSDHSKLKQWENVCIETQGMIPDTESRLKSAITDLKALLDAPELKGTSELKNAKDEIKKAEDAISKGTSTANHN